jgi:hypothetical protein
MHVHPTSCALHERASRRPRRDRRHSPSSPTSATTTRSSPRRCATMHHPGSTTRELTHLSQYASARGDAVVVVNDPMELPRPRRDGEAGEGLAGSWSSWSRHSREGHPAARRGARTCRPAADSELRILPAQSRACSPTARSSSATPRTPRARAAGGPTASAVAARATDDAVLRRRTRGRSSREPQGWPSGRASAACSVGVDPPYTRSAPLDLATSRVVTVACTRREWRPVAPPRAGESTCRRPWTSSEHDGESMLAYGRHAPAVP